MIIISKSKKLCHDCMEEHEVWQVQVEENNTYKNTKVTYDAIYQYCCNSDTLTANEKMIKQNNLSMKDAFRKNIGLLQSADIINIRSKYMISAKDFAKILGWGDTTIIRYENHQVQDQVHNDLLVELNTNPEMFLEKLKKSKAIISVKAYKKYYEHVLKLIHKNKNNHLINLINACYATVDRISYMGGKELDLEKTIAVINYIATHIKKLHKTKLMKLLWYCDFSNYKESGQSLTGMAYCVEQYGALPLASQHIVYLDGINMKEEVTNEYISYLFTPVKNKYSKSLSKDECSIINKVIKAYGEYTTAQIVEKMHSEQAYIETRKGKLIDYSYAKSLLSMLG